MTTIALILALAGLFLTTGGVLMADLSPAKAGSVVEGVSKPLNKHEVTVLIGAGLVLLSVVACLFV